MAHDDYGRALTLRKLHGHPWSGDLSPRAPLSLNLVAGWPLFKAPERKQIEQRYAEHQQKTAIAQGGPISIPGFSPSATPPPSAMNWCASSKPLPFEHRRLRQS